MVVAEEDYSSGEKSRHLRRKRKKCDQSLLSSKKVVKLP
jgi:hypothetical protein